MYEASLRWTTSHGGRQCVRQREEMKREDDGGEIRGLIEEGRRGGDG